MDSTLTKGKSAEEENAQHLPKVRHETAVDPLPKENGSLVCYERELVEVDQKAKEDASLVQFVENLSEEFLQEELEGESSNESINLGDEMAANSSEQMSSTDQDSLMREVQDLLSTDSGAQSLSIVKKTSEEETTEGDSQSAASETRFFEQEVLSSESFRGHSIQGELRPSGNERVSLLVEATNGIRPAAISKRYRQSKEKPLTISQCAKESEIPSTIKVLVSEDVGQPNNSLQPSSDIPQSSIPQSSTSESKVSRQEIVSPEKTQSGRAVEEEDLRCSPNNADEGRRWENAGGFIQALNNIQSLDFSISKDRDELPDKEMGKREIASSSCKKKDQCCQTCDSFDNCSHEVIILKKKTAIMAKDAEAMEKLLEDVRKDYEQLQKNFERRESEIERLEEDKTLIEELKKENRWMKKEKTDLKLKLAKKEEKVAEIEDKHQSVCSKYLLLKAERDSFLKDTHGKTTETLFTEIQRHLLKSDDDNKESKREVVPLESSSIAENMAENLEPSSDPKVSESLWSCFAQSIQQVVMSVKEDLQNTITITSQDSTAQYEEIVKELRKLRNEYCCLLKKKDSEIGFFEEIAHGLQSKIQCGESKIATLMSLISSADKDKERLNDQIRGLENEILEAKSANRKIKAELNRMRWCLKGSCTAEEFEELDRFYLEFPDVCCGDVVRQGNTNYKQNILELRRKVTKLITLLTRAKKIILKLKHEQHTGKERLEEKVSEAVEKERCTRLRLHNPISSTEEDRSEIKEVNAQFVAVKVENAELEAVKTELEKSLHVARERHGTELQSINTINMLHERLELAKAQIENLREKNSRINMDRLRLKRRLGNERASAHARKVITADSSSDEYSMSGDRQVRRSSR